MLEILEKFIQKLKNLDNYWILRQEKEYIIIGTKIIILEHRMICQPDSFTPHIKNVDKELPVFFIITVSKKSLDLDKIFINGNIPILAINNMQKRNQDIVKDNIKELLDEFVSKSFKY